MRVTSGWALLWGLARRQHSFEEMSQRWPAVGDTVSDLIDPGFKLMSSRTDSDVFTTELIFFGSKSFLTYFSMRSIN